jgi:hypothetical protein
MRVFSIEGGGVEHRHVVFAAHRHPHLLAVRRVEGLVRRAPDVGGVLHRVGRGVDEGHRVRADRDDGERAVVRREAHAMHQHLAPVERAEVAGRWVAQADHAEQLVVHRVGDRHGVGELLGRVDPVPVAHGSVGVGSGTRRLAGVCAKSHGGQCSGCEQVNEAVFFHVVALRVEVRESCAAGGSTSGRPAWARVPRAAAAGRAQGASRQSPAAARR